MKKTLIIIGGATASGKTSLAIEAAKILSTEIISADSRQCFIELNIGVAKQTEDELKAIQHHFVNSHSILEVQNAASFEKYALAALENIFKQSNFAICTGGTGLYIKALTDGIDAMPPINIEIKTQVEQAFLAHGIEWLQQEIKNNDHDFFEHGEMQNPARMLRALIFKLSNKKSILDFQKQQIATRSFDIKYYCIDIDRAILYDRINKRVEKMMQNGLVLEVENLLNYKNLQTLKTVGYTEIFAYLSSEISLENAIESIKQNSRRYAKRQLTWFRNDERFEFLNSENILEKIKLLQ